MDRKSYDGFIMPDGTFIDLDDTEAMFGIAKATYKTPGEIAQNMVALALERNRKGRASAAYGYFQKALGQSDTIQMKVSCMLALGQLKEQQEDYAGAMDWYRQALGLEPPRDDTWYLLSNNLGYCLNKLGLYAEGAEACRRAIVTNPGRHNAHKNLGTALEGLGQHADAAASYTQAAELCSEDPRTLLLLEALVRSHPEVEKEVPGVRTILEARNRDRGAGLN